MKSNLGLPQRTPHEILKDAKELYEKSLEDMGVRLNNGEEISQQELDLVSDMRDFAESYENRLNN